ncbi:PREDICTED: transmembrane protein 135-like [Priapulus caudatus]|uniref:Transmembrane protein 135-like n=1 Tax=Priapulus caudatus TaxID=37621 RepID=A0ABM1EE95_PRICU|nr:PREDICTED: transmembrane protein 135-like [Priapulus caudatus]
MSLISKLLFEPYVHYSCYELGHTWTPGCWKAFFDTMTFAFRASLRTYASFYLLTAALKNKNKEYYLTKFLPDMLRSTVFLTANACLFIGAFCMIGKVLGKYGLITAGFVPAFIASFLSVLIERKSRRGMLAVYLTNLASEYLFKSLVAHGYIKPIKFGEVFMFMITAAVYMFLFCSHDGLAGAEQKGIKFIVGDLEQVNGGDEWQAKTETRKKQVLLGAKYLLGLTKYINVLNNVVKSWRKHHLCRHSHSCLSYVIQGTLRNFMIGYGIQGCMKLVGSVPKLLKQPHLLLTSLTHGHNVRLGCFLAGFCGIFRGVCCLLRWLTAEHKRQHAAVAGFLAGSSMGFYRSVPISLYLFWKLLETLYYKGIEAGHLPSFRHFDVMLYAFSTAINFHAAVFSPHLMRPAYWDFLKKLTNQRFAEMNRLVLDIYGTNAAKICPSVWPDYDPNHTHLTLPAIKDMFITK